jgi:hypothetical protein
MATNFLWAQIFDCRAGDCELRSEDVPSSDPVGARIEKLQKAKFGLQNESWDSPLDKSEVVKAAPALLPEKCYDDFQVTKHEVRVNKSGTRSRVGLNQYGVVVTSEIVSIF